MRRNRSYTLSEVAITVGLLLVLVGLSLPALMGMRESAQNAVARESVMNAYRTAKAHWAADRVYSNMPALLEQLSTDHPSFTFTTEIPDGNAHDPRTVYVSLSSTKMGIGFCAYARTSKAWCLQATEPGAPAMPRLVATVQPTDGPSPTFLLRFSTFGMVYSTQCSVNGAPLVDCTSPFTGAAAMGANSIHVVASGPAGVAEGTYSWTRS